MLFSVVQLGHGGDGTLPGEHFFKRPHRDHQRHIGLAVAGHVRAAIGKGSRVDGELERSTGIASTNVAHQDVVVLHFGLGFGFRFLH